MIQLSTDVQQLVYTYTMLFQVHSELKTMTQSLIDHLSRHRYDMHVRYKQTGYNMLFRVVLLHIKMKRWRIRRTGVTRRFYNVP